MTDDEPSTIAKTALMKKLSDEERNALIEGADNVLDGRAKFGFKAKQVQLAESYKKPQTPPPGGTA